MNTNKKASEQFDLEDSITFDADVEDLRETAHALERAEGANVGEMGSERLADFVHACKRLESAAEEARKEYFEAELSDRVDEGETIKNVRKASGTNRYVTDDAAAFDAVLDAGEDPREVAKVSASKLSDVLGNDADEFISESSYSYFRPES